MPSQSYLLFDSRLGQCGLCWQQEQLVRLLLPEHDRDQLAARMQQLGAQLADPPGYIRRLVVALQLQLSGGGSQLPEVPLATAGLSPFAVRVYRAARGVPYGQVATYGELAARVDSPGAAPAVGRALGANPFPLVVPCHRIIGAGGNLGGFSAVGGLEVKARLLALEAGARRAGHDCLEWDPECAAVHLAGADRGLASVIRRIGPCSLQPRTPASVFAALAEAIISQQLVPKAASESFARSAASWYLWQLMEAW